MTIEDLPVLSPDEAARRHGMSAVFIVSIWRAEGGFRTSGLVADLRSRGCLHVARIGELYWAHPVRFLPYYAIDLPSRALPQSNAIRQAFAMLADAASRGEFVEQSAGRFRRVITFEPDPANRVRLEAYAASLGGRGYRRWAVLASDRDGVG